MSPEQLTARFAVNGVPCEVEAGPDDMLLDFLRRRLGLTGTKEGCDHGACGACTVLVDGLTRVSCLTPLTSVEGRAVTTVEGLSAGGLHPVQRAMAACDALQCGFCTPGFVIEAWAFHDRWRQERGTTAPQLVELSLALRGHLCRCGAQPRILEAVSQACQGLHDTEGPAPPRLEALEKVSGRAIYTVDVRLPGQLEGRIVRSQVPAARVVAIDSSRALALVGVHAVVVLTPVGSRTRFRGQEIAAVAAVDAGTARRAADLIRVEIEPLPFVLDPELATRDDAPIVHPGLFFKDAPNAAEVPVLPALWHGNVRGPQSWLSHHAASAREELERAQAAGRGVRGAWRTNVQVHSAMEPHAAVAEWTGERSLHVHASTQACHDLAEDLAERYDLDRGDVRVSCAHVGGGFGAKAELTAEIVAAVELARATRLPVRVALDRHEELSVIGGRAALRIDLGLAASEDGRISAMVVDSRAASGLAVGSVIGPILVGAYDCPAACEDRDIVTNTAPSKPMRGPGGPGAFWALEQAVDELAATIGRDPIALRLASDPNPNRRRLLEWAASLQAFRERGAPGAARGRLRRGVGVAAATWPYFVETDIGVTATAGRDGLAVEASVQDMGTGSRTVLATAAAAALGVAPQELVVRIGDSALASRGPSSSASRTTASIAPAAAEAGRMLKERLKKLGRERLAMKTPVVGAGGLKDGARFMRWADVFAAEDPIACEGKRLTDRGGFALFGVKIPGLDAKLGEGHAASVQVTELEVDVLLGQVRVLRAWAGLSVGRIVTPRLAESQVHGGIVQGIGAALHEERQLDPRSGIVLSDNLEEYRIPGIADVPEIEVHFDEAGFEHVQGGGVGLGEISTLAVAASIGNAIFHATGRRFREMPILTARLIEGLTP